MKTSEYYDDMRSVTGCVKWAGEVGIKREIMGDAETNWILPGAKGELDISLIYDDDSDDLSFINMMNRLRRFREEGKNDDTDTD